jgi:hypothetical protein
MKEGEHRLRGNRSRSRRRGAGSFIIASIFIIIGFELWEFIFRGLQLYFMFL